MKAKPATDFTDSTKVEALRMGDNQKGPVLFRLSLLALLLLCGLPALAQTTSVSGTVTDEQDARLAGATITLTSSAGATRSEIADEMGTYKFLQLSPGVYQLKAELQGFKTFVRTDVELMVDTPTVVDFKMQIGEITLRIIVEERVSKLNTQDATLGNAIEGHQIRQLPLESRNVAALLSIQPAVTPSGYVSGSRSDQSNLTLDGIDVNEQQTGEAFETVLRITPDSVQEFRVTTALPTATQGRSSGGQVSLITRSGTNQWHGSLYHFHRNTVTTANDFFNNRSGVERPKLIRNLFGGSVGGPIVKDRALFFYNYEGRRDAKGESILRTVPLPSLGQGAVRYVTASGVKTLTSADLNRIYAVGTNPAAIRVLAEAAAKYPANDTGVGDGLNFSGFRFNAPRPVKQNAHTATLSFNLTRNANHTLLLRGNYQHDLERGVPQFPDTPGTNFWSHPTGWSAIHTWTASNRLVNTLRFGLTRQAFSSQGDSSDNSIVFRDVFSPRLFSPRTLSRTTPIYNIVDDVSWVKGNHTWQFGANIRAIRNNRISFDKSFDSALTNASFYDASGAVLNIAIPDIEGNGASAQAALAAVIGRYSEYSGSFNFGIDGSIQPQGDGIGRLFATEEYEFFTQDSWRVRPNLTLTLGLRYGLNTPVYEANGLQVSPDVSLGEFFERRKESAARGIPVNDIISVDLAGPKRDRPGFYKLDKNNLAPRAAIAWSPEFDNSFLRKIFGGPRQSVFRGGFAMLYDRVGSALAVNFDLNNQLGFSSSEMISANTYNVSDRPAPLFTGFNQVIRTLPGIKIPSTLTFPQQKPADEALRIESTLDDTITTPAHYSWNFSVAREFTGGLSLEASYIGRSARNLLANRDIMHLNNLVDTKSGMDWYEAAGLLYDLRYKRTPASAVQPIPYFENLFPNFREGGQPTATQSVFSLVEGGDYTFVQLSLDDRGILPNAFFHPQYAALTVQSTVAYSDYHAGTLTIRERFKDSLSFDLNYTFSKSLDNASSLERDSQYSGIILNPLRPDDNKAISNFDLTHIINSAAIWELPVGSGRTYLSSMNPLLNQILGGWQLTGIFRWNSGLPNSVPFDATVWATNWNVPSNGTRIRPVSAAPTKSGVHPNFFADPRFAYQSFRNAKPGETGERNTFRRPGFVSLDFGLVKIFKLSPERHKLQLRWEVFNATNTQRLSGPTESRTGYGLQVDPHLGEPALDFGRITSIQGNPRIMQFALRWDF